MISHRTAAATLSRWPRGPLAVLLVVAAGVLLAGLPQAAHAATTGDFEIVGLPAGLIESLPQNPALPNLGPVYLVRGGLPTCDSSNNCTGGLTQPKTLLSSGAPAWVNTVLQVDTMGSDGFDSGFRGTVSFQLSGLPAGVTSQTAASTTITDNTTVVIDEGGFLETVNGTDTTLQLSADSTVPLGTFSVTVTATSGSLSHSVTIPVNVVDSLPNQFKHNGLEVCGSSACTDSATFGGTPAVGTVNVVFPAPASGTVVSLASSDPAAAVPASVTVPAGATSATFSITTQPVTTTTAVSFTASLPGQTITSFNQLSVEPPPLVQTVNISPASATPGRTPEVSGNVVLNEPFPRNSSPVTVALSSSNPAAASVPATISFGPPGSPTSLDCVFVITLAPNAPAGTVTISATLNGHTTTAVLTILDVISSSSGNWDKHDHVLTVKAATNTPSDTLQVFVSGTTQLIGTMTNLGNGNYQGQFPWPVNPGKVDIKSSGGATLTIPIT